MMILVNFALGELFVSLFFAFYQNSAQEKFMGNTKHLANTTDKPQPGRYQ
jgi:hypothetical protein